MAEHHLTVPLSNDQIIKLKAGDLVYFSGTAWTCNTKLQDYVFEQKHSLPFSAEGKNLVIHAAPVVVREGGQWRMASFMPGASIRFEKWGARCIEKFGLKAIIGRTTMGATTLRAMVANICVHCSPVGVPVQQFVEKIKVENVYLRDELGEVEAAWLLRLHDLGPMLVDIDTTGRNYYEALDGIIAEKKKKAYQKLGIPAGFEFTKLY